MSTGFGIEEPIVGWLWLSLAPIWGLRMVLKYGLVPKREHLRDSKSLLFISTWNVFSTKKWTDAGVALHKRVFMENLAFAVAWLAAYFLLSAIL